MTIRIDGKETVQAAALILENEGHHLPYLICTDGGEAYGSDGQTLVYVSEPRAVIIVFDDGRAFPALVQLVDGVLECTPIALPPAKEPLSDEYIGAWALPWR